MAVQRLISGWAGTLLIGVLSGFIVASVVGIFVQDSGLFGASGESPVTRAYMLGLLQRDPGSITGIRPNPDIAQRALELQGAEQTRSTTMQPLSLTYLGGASLGRLSVHIYAVGMRGSSGTDQFFPLALTVVAGKVVRSE